LANESALTCSGTELSGEKFSRMFSEVNETVFPLPNWKESPTLTARTVLDGRCEEKGQRDHQEQHSVNRVRRQLCGGGEERKVRSSGEAKTAKLSKRLAECTASGGLWKECKERSTRLSRTIWYVPCQAGAGWRGVQSPSRRLRNGKPSSEAKTCRVHHIGRPLRGV
jgi:hypothetical protein